MSQASFKNTAESHERIYIYISVVFGTLWRFVATRDVSDEHERLSFYFSVLGFFVCSFFYAALNRKQQGGEVLQVGAVG